MCFEVPLLWAYWHALPDESAQSIYWHALPDESVQHALPYESAQSTLVCMALSKCCTFDSTPLEDLQDAYQISCSLHISVITCIS